MGLYDRILLRIDRLRDQWDRRGDIAEDVSEGLRDLPQRWSDTDRSSKIAMTAMIALCAVGIFLTLA